MASNFKESLGVLQKKRKEWPVRDKMPGRSVWKSNVFEGASRQKILIGSGSFATSTILDLASLKICGLTI